jgi:hypothetical protein
MAAIKVLNNMAHRQEVLVEIENTIRKTEELIASADEASLNKIPFENSWSIAQVADHITRSSASIAHALQLESRPASRDLLLRRKELADTFLNMNHKFKSPDFILPTQAYYNKEDLAVKLSKTYRHLLDVAGEVELGGMIQHPAFGDITKHELLYFVLYHTQRHLFQMENIAGIVLEKLHS